MLTEKIIKAFALAAEIHKTQVRKIGGTPYLAHLMAVCALVLENGGDEESAMGALLHDAAEDQGGEKILQTIALRFGPRVSHLVADLSDSLTDLTEGDKKAPWKERKRLYLAKLPDHDHSARLISLCDKLHNLECLLEALRVQGANAWNFFNGGQEGTLWYYRELAIIFSTMDDLPEGLKLRFSKRVKDMEDWNGR